LEICALYMTFYLLVASIAYGQSPPTSAPALLHIQTVDEVIQVLREPRLGDGSVDLYRKRQACDQVRSDFKDAEKAVPDLIGLLSDDRPALGLSAMHALERIAPLARDQLVTAARDPNAAVRFGAVQALSPLGKECEPLIMDLSRNDPDHRVQMVATYSLCKMGSSEASPMVVQLLADKNVNTQIEMMRAMKDWPLTEPVAIQLAKATCSSSDLVRHYAVDLLVHDPNHFMNVLVNLRLSNPGDGLRGEYEALEVIEAYPHQFWGVAFSCLNSHDPRSASIARDMMSRMGPRAIPWLPQLAQLAANPTIVERGNNKAVYEAVCHSLVGDHEPTKAELEGIEPDRLLEGLLSILSYPQVDPGLKVIALGPLDRFGDKARPAIPQVAGLLAYSLTDSEQAAVLDFLSHHSSPGYAANQGAIRALGSASVELRVAAEHYLAAAGTSVYPQLLQLLHGSDPEASSAIHVMQTLPSPDKVLAGGLVEQLSRTDPEFRRSAIVLLDTWISSRATTQPQSSPLVECRQQLTPLTNDPDPVVRDHAQAILKLLNPSSQTAAVPTTVPPASVPAGKAGAAFRWSGILFGLFGLLLVAILIGWIIIHSLSKQAQSHIKDSNKLKCERCRAVIPAKSRFCRRCGLNVPAVF
jgi:HEAT repeat protein